MSRKPHATPQPKHIFRYWVEIRDLASDSVRKLPLTAMRAVCLKRYKEDEAHIPDREFLQLKDGGHTVEAESFDDLRALLREKYPDSLYERTLNFDRDLERERAWDNLISLVAERVADDIVAERSPERAPDLRKTKLCRQPKSPKT